MKEEGGRTGEEGRGGHLGELWGPYRQLFRLRIYAIPPHYPHPV